MVQVAVLVFLILVLRLLQREVALELLPLVVISRGLVIEPSYALCRISVNVLPCSRTSGPLRGRAFVTLSLLGLQLHLQVIYAALQTADFSLSLA